MNIFLTNSLNHADGLARDLSSGEPRDVWKVRVDSKHLIQTLDGNIKYYQTIHPDTPIISISMA